MPAIASLSAVRKISRVLSPLCLLVALAWPLVVAGSVIGGPISALISTVGIHANETQVASIGLWQRVLCAGIGVLPALAYAGALLALADCLRGFAAGDYFGLRCVLGLRRFAGRSFVASLLGLIAQPLCSVVLSWHFGVGQRQLALGLSSDQIGMLLLAGVVWTIAGVMSEARRIADENAQFV
ncbi:hypothetical protein [Niveibacterium sp. SC-1]|uniref:hypothetical protein n=1 Tax=Niveibacterium sp. SC-1 TaxID=3135646 RepID=UPI00311F17D8